MLQTLKTYYLVIILGISYTSYAEVVFDGTLGTVGALSGPDFAIESHLGQQVGNNLFHSFDTFNINQHESATFSGPETINNIISRVTGGKASNINGLLRSTIPDADMYLINPAGIMFGEHVNLDVQGSFHASTANYLLLGKKNGRFDASNPEKSLLTVAPPSAFGFLNESPADIEKYGFLTVADGKTISLIGGNLTLQDNNLIGRKKPALWAPGGQINLVSVASSGEVPVDPENIPDNAFEQFGTIKITDTPFNKNNLERMQNIDVSGEGGGRIYIQGGQIFMENVRVFANTRGTKNGQGITIKAKEIKFISDSYIDTRTQSSGSAGNITLTATEKINIKGNWNSDIRSGLFSHTTGNGQGGNIEITAPDITLEGYTLVAAETWGLGDAGNILLKMDTLNLKNGAEVSVNSGETLYAGKGGELRVIANKAIFITGQSKLLSNTSSRNEGGSIYIWTPLLEIQDEGSIQAATTYKGNAGNITLNVDQLDISNGGSITTETLGNGMGGEIDITANQISIADKGIITASSSGAGNAGNIKITSPGYLHLRNSEITTSAKNSNAGKIILNSEFIILDNSYIKADADEGDAGNINIRTTGIYNFSGESAQDITAESKKGLDGLVTINSPDIDISNSLTQILPKTFLDAASLLRKPCATRSGLNLSSLSIIRGDVVPKDPMQLAAPGFKSCHVY